MDKISTKKRIRRCPDWVAALLTALLVHLVLLVLFRYSPAPGSSEQENLARVSPVALDNPANVELARWTELHDPALMTAVDRSKGFSSAAENVKVHKLLEDLPQPRHLSEPRSPEPAVLPERLSGSNLAPRDTVYLQNAQAAATEPVILTHNDRVLVNVKPLQRMLSENLPAVKLPVSVVIDISSPVRSGLLPRLRLVRSSGSEQLDRRALDGASRLLAVCDQTDLTGELVFHWREAANAGAAR